MTKNQKPEKNKKKKGAGFYIRVVLLIAAAAVFIFAAWNLYSIYSGYAKADDEYDKLKNDYTSSYSKDVSDDSKSPESSVADSSDTDPANGELIEDAKPPLSVDFSNLQSINPEVVGWLYIDALPNISYPICRGTDNDYYLHHTFEKQSVFAGSIFMDFNCKADFTDPNTILYGHNMKNQSMFGLLKFLCQQDTYDSDPYFWVLTPNGNYRYHIYAAFETAVNSHAYYLFTENNAEFLSWEQEMQQNSAVTNNVALSEKDHTVMLSTCTSNSETRTVVFGKCVSTKRP